MPNALTRFFNRMRGDNDEVSRYSLSEYLQDRVDPFALSLPIFSTTASGQPAEEIENSYSGYTYGAYKSSGVIFATILSRMLLFTEARFQYQRMTRGRPGDLWSNASLAMLEYPWPNGTTGELLARMEQDVSLSGNAYITNEGDRLRRLRPDWVSIVLTERPEDAVKSDVLGYLYSPGGYGSGGDVQVYLPDEIAHWSPIPDPIAQYRGMSWLTPVINEVGADLSATQHKKAFFDNGATMGLVISVKETVTEEQFKKFVEAANQAHQGARNAYRPMYVGGGSDVTVAGADMRQLDFKSTQGAGETRITAAGGVPAVIVGLSEGLQAATYSNYGQARRKFGDHWARPQWRSACASLQNIVPCPTDSRLWYDDRDIAFLREDQKDAAEIQQIKAGTIRSYIDAGFEAKSAISAVEADDRTLLVHSGLFSVQLQPPGTVATPDTPALPTETPKKAIAAKGKVNGKQP